MVVFVAITATFLVLVEVSEVVIVVLMEIVSFKVEILAVALRIKVIAILFGITAKDTSTVMVATNQISEEHCPSV